MSKLKYKVGDRVRIKSLDWYNENKDEVGNIRYKRDGSAYPVFFSKYMSNFCGEILTIKSVFKHSYHMNETSSCEFWTDEMIEELAQEYPKIAIQGDPTRGVSVIDALIALGGENDKDSIATTKHACYFIDHEGKIRSRLLENLPEGFKLYTLEEWRKENMEKENADKKELLLGLVETQKGQELIPHKDYEIKQDGDKFYLVKKKKEYPKTFEECCKILGLLNVDLCFNADYRSFDASKEQWKRLGLMNQFYQLLICRDAYWKIAGEEMGLGKPWKPNWEDENQEKHIIGSWLGTIQGLEENFVSHPLAFPTEEMRDSFYENFKELIEQCKELS